MFKTVAALSLVAGALAQAGGVSIAGLNISTQCLQTLEGLATNSSFGNCSYITTLLPAITSNNASLIPYLDEWMSGVCYNQPCSNATLMAAATQIETGCAADLANSTILNNNTINEVFSLYPLIREVLCLKTENPYTNQSYMGTLGNPVIPVTQYNSTGGYFCVSSMLTQLTAYYKQNFSLGFVEELVMGSNSTVKNLTQAINPNILCNECLFGIVDLIEEQYPMVGNVSALEIFGGLGVNATSTLNNMTTLNMVMDGECQYIPLVVSQNGTLPFNISETAVNSTFLYNVTSSPINGTNPMTVSMSSATQGVNATITTTTSGMSSMSASSAVSLTAVTSSAAASSSASSSASASA